MTSEEEVQSVVAKHRERFGRLDVLVNNAGVGIGAPVAEHATKKIDMQIDLNLRAIILFYRECADLLRRGRRRAPQRARGQHRLDRRQVRARRGCRSTAPRSSRSSAGPRR